MEAYDLQSFLYVALGAVAGLAGGWLFHRIWRRILPRSRSADFWRTLPGNLQGMLRSPEPADLLRHYRTLIKATAAFGGRNLLAVLAGIAPTAVFFLSFDAYDLPGRNARAIEVHPPTAAARLPVPPDGMRIEDERMLIDRARFRDSSLQFEGVTLDHEMLAQKQAFCGTLLSCLGFDLLLFETHRLRAVAGGQSGSSIILRPRLIDRNPIWPYLDDLEFWFFVAVIIGSGVAAWRGRRAKVD